MPRRERYILYIGITLMMLSCVSFSVLRTSRADAQSAGASVTVAAACSFTSTVNSAHTASVPAGTYKTDIGQTTFNVVCNDPGGYSIYAVGYSNNEWGNTKLLATVGGTLNPNYDIITGTATNGNTSNWAMKMTAVSGTSTPTIENSFGSYKAIPDTSTKVASFPSVTDATSGSSVKATYATYVTNGQPAGNYNGKVRFIMVHPSTETPLGPVTTNPGYISYNPNASGVVDTMGNQSISNTATEATLWASNFQRPGYGFAGWNTAFDYSGTNYGPNETITFEAGAYSGTNPGLSLYAVWVKSAGSLQDWSGCPSLAQGAVTALTDQRDNNTYAIAKLADGKCWMIENLRLGGNNPTTISSTNSNIADNFTLSASVTPSVTAWCTDYNSTCIDQSMLNSDNITNPVSNMTNSNTSTAVYSYGNYYNWYSATAGTGKYSVSSTNTSVSDSICPKGWHLPKGGNKNNEANNEFWQLIVTNLNNSIKPANYDSNTYPYYTGSAEAGPVDKLIRTYPNNFLHSGYAGGSSLSNRGSSGLYWSSTASSSNNAYSLYFYSTSVYPGSLYSIKYSGRTVRCVSGV